MALGVLTQEQYSLILGGAVLSIALNSFVFKLAGPLEQAVRRVPGLAAVFDRHMRRPERRRRTRWRAMWLWWATAAQAAA